MNFEMFTTIASLTERVKCLEYVLVGQIDDADFTNAVGLEHKMCEARTLFSLSASAKRTGIMTFEELDNMCSAGGVDVSLYTLLRLQGCRGNACSVSGRAHPSARTRAPPPARPPPPLPLPRP